jgi:rhodanese-related sulfurtransferase
VHADLVRGGEEEVLGDLVDGRSHCRRNIAAAGPGRTPALAPAKLLAPPPDAHYHPPVRILLQALLLAAAGAGMGLALNPLTPRPARLSAPVRSAAEATAACLLPGAGPVAPRIAVGEAAPLCIACTAGFVDARSAAEYAAGHVSGAIHLAPGEPPLAALLYLERFRTVVVYDGDPFGAQAEAVAGLLRSRGMADVRVLSGSWPAWLAAGAPGESGPCDSCAAASSRRSGGMP